MNDNLDEILKHFFKNRIPLLFSIFLILLFCMPFNFHGSNVLHPQAGLICMYYWVTKRPHSFGYISVYILGFLMDVCSTTPLGMNCITLIILTFGLKEIYRYLKPASFITDWMLFAFVCICYTSLKWLFFALYFKQFFNIMLILPNIFSTLAFYPLLAYLNNIVRISCLTQEHMNE